MVILTFSHDFSHWSLWLFPSIRRRYRRCSIILVLFYLMEHCNSYSGRADQSGVGQAIRARSPPKLVDFLRKLTITSTLNQSLWYFCLPYFAIVRRVSKANGFSVFFFIYHVFVFVYSGEIQYLIKRRRRRCCSSFFFGLAAWANCLPNVFGYLQNIYLCVCELRGRRGYFEASKCVKKILFSNFNIMCPCI